MGWRSIVVWYFARTNRLIKKSGISSNSLAVLKTEWYLMAYCKLEGLLGGEEIVESVLEGLLGGEGSVESVLEGLLGYLGGFCGRFLGFSGRQTHFLRRSLGHFLGSMSTV